VSDTGQEPRRPIRLRPQAETDAAIKNHVETTHYFDEQTGELYEPDSPPVVPGWGVDDDDDDAS
jgi:hypothetical protein